MASDDDKITFTLCSVLNNTTVPIDVGAADHIHVVLADGTILEIGCQMYRGGLEVRQPAGGALTVRPVAANLIVIKAHLPGGQS